MSYDLTGEKISFTYGRVVQIVSGSYYDGFGNVLPIGTSSVVISGSTSGFATTGSNTFIGNEIVSGSVIVTNGITGSLYGTSSYSLNTISSSYALTASYSNTSIYSNTSTSSSYALSASYAPIDTNITVSWSSNSSTASYVVTAQTASYYGGSVISSSYALTASFALNGGGGGTTLTTGSTYPITSSWSNNVISSSYSLTASYWSGSIISSSYSLSSISASYAPTDTNITASWSLNSLTASYYGGNAESASYAQTASYASNTFSLTTGSTYPITSSWANNSNSSSYSNNSTSASYAPTNANITASYFDGSVISSSYALTASFALNGGGSNILDWTGSNFVSNTTTQSIAAFNTSGYPMLVTPTSDNVYLAVQNGVMKWIPIASVAVTFLNVIFNQEINFEDGQYNTSIVPVQYISDFNQEIDVKDGQYNTAIIPVQNISDFNQEINVKDGQYNTSIVPVVLFISSFSSGSI